ERILVVIQIRRRCVIVRGGTCTVLLPEGFRRRTRKVLEQANGALGGRVRCVHEPPRNSSVACSVDGERRRRVNRRQAMNIGLQHRNFRYDIWALVERWARAVQNSSRST